MQGVAYIGGEYVALADAKISVMTHAFNYGTGTFEGIRGYWNAAEEQIYVFRARDHFERLHNSARILAIDLPHDVDALVAILMEVLRRSGFRADVYIRPIAYKSGLGIGVSMTGVPDALVAILMEVLRRSGFRADVYIRPIAYKCGLGIGVSMTGVPDALVMYAQPMGNYIDIDAGISCCVSSWRRNGDNAMPPRAKITGSYLNSALAKHEALVNGYDEAIMLTEAGHVCEGSAENIFIIKNRTLITPPLSDGVLEGITRATLMEIAQAELAAPTIERTIQRTELYTADEVFLCGTGAQVSPVTSIDRRPVGSGEVGPLTQALQHAYFDVVRGNSRAYAAWLQPVYERSAADVVRTPSLAGAEARLAP